MASSGSRDGSQAKPPMALPDHESMLGAGISARNLEAFSRKVTTTAGELMRPLGGEVGSGTRYVAAMGEVRKGFRRPDLQRRMFSMTQASPMEVMRSRLSSSAEMQYRALTYLPDELLETIPADDNNTYSLFQAFQATVPNDASNRRKAHRRHQSRGRKLLAENGGSGHQGPPSMVDLKVDKDALTHRLQMLAVRKSVSSSEIREIDGKMGNLNRRRKVVLDQLSDLEQEEASIERDLLDVDNRIELIQDELDDGALSPVVEAHGASETSPEAQVTDESFMSESIYEKLPSSKARRHKTVRRKSMPILHEHIEPGTKLNEIQAHHDVVTALDFDAPFGTMVTAALDDTVRVWDLQAGRCIGMLEGHHASVRCLQVEDNLVATGSTDASIRLWDLARAERHPRQGRADGDGGIGHFDDDDDDDDAEDACDDRSSSSRPATSGMQECALISLEAHVDEVTALHLQGEVLVSGSADKTLRQWDLVKGRCVQTLDVLWAAAQASTTLQTPPSPPDGDGLHRWRQIGRPPDASADFVGALQCFDAALACGTADGMVRLWDLRSGQVHRSLIGHTGPVTCLQFDNVHLITGSLDRSIRIWDLRTGSIFDAYAYDRPITSMRFDHRRIVAAAGEAVIKVYDKVDGRHWNCGGGGGGSGGGSNGLDLPLDHVFTPTSSASASASISVSSSQQTLGVGGVGAGGVTSIVEQVRIKDGYLIEGRKDGMVGIWSC